MPRRWVAAASAAAPAPSGTRPGGTATTTTSSTTGSTTDLTALLKATTTRWAAATTGSQTAATWQLSSGKAVIAIGGFTGSDNSPTLAQFQKYVSQGLISYYIAGGGMGGGAPGAGGSAAEIGTWVAAHYTATTVGGTTVYHLTATAK